MIAQLPLDKMSITDKISTMELLWDDICKNPNNYPSPAWHGTILREREERLRQGKDHFEDWEEVKKELFVYAVVDCRKDPAWIRDRLG